MSAIDAFNKNDRNRPFDSFVSNFNGASGLKDIDTSVVRDDNMKANSGRTVYMDSNIAITDGSATLSDNAPAIPSVYHALVGLKEGVNAINAIIGKDEMNAVGSNTAKPSSVTNAISQLIAHTSSMATDGAVAALDARVKVLENIEHSDYALKDEVEDTYLKTTDAAKTYLKTTDAAKTYLAQNDASSTYATIKSVTDLSNKVGTTDIDVSGYTDDTKTIVGAINMLDNKIESKITNCASTVDLNIYASTDTTKNVCTISPGKKKEPTDCHATEKNSDNTLRLSANDIEFEIPAPTLTGYKVTSTSSVSAVDADSGETININSGDYWIPIETTTSTVSSSVTLGSCGRVIRGGEIFSSHCRLSGDLTISTDTADQQSFTAAGKLVSSNPTIVYNLGAIIEAIQELNRRTMFIDTDMSFAGAIHYGDVTKTDITGATHEDVADGLPSASNSNIHKQATSST